VTSFAYVCQHLSSKLPAFDKRCHYDVTCAPFVTGLLSFYDLSKERRTLNLGIGADREVAAKNCGDEPISVKAGSRLFILN
jgi:hypothetical protein